MNLANTLMVIGLAALPFSANAPGDGRDQEAAALVQKLGDSDYKVRKEAYRALEKLGPAAREALEKGLKSDDAEVRWSASLLLDRLDESRVDGAGGRLRERAEADSQSRPAPGVRRWRPLRTGDDAMQEVRDAMRRLEEWHRQFEREHPGWFHGSPFGLRRFDDVFRGFDGFDAFDPFEQGGGLELGPGSSFSRTIDRDGRRESLSIRVDADGRVIAEQEKDGEKSRFEADSVEALRQRHPELLEGFGGVRVQVGPFGRRFSRPQIEKPEAPRVAPPERPRLGVQVAPVSAEVARHLEIEEGVGLEVVEVIAGSAAEKLGVRPRDILVEVNGREIRGVDDVAQALAGKDPAATEVTVIRRGEEKTLDRAK